MIWALFKPNLDRYLLDYEQISASRIFQPSFPRKRETIMLLEHIPDHRCAAPEMAGNWSTEIRTWFRIAAASLEPINP